MSGMQSEVLLHEGLYQVPDPEKPGEFFLVRATITAERNRPVRSDLSGELGEFLARAVTG